MVGSANLRDVSPAHAASGEDEVDFSGPERPTGICSFLVFTLQVSDRRAVLRRVEVAGEDHGRAGPPLGLDHLMNPSNRLVKCRVAADAEMRVEEVDAPFAVFPIEMRPHDVALAPLILLVDLLSTASSERELGMLVEDGVHTVAVHYAIVADPRSECGYRVCFLRSHNIRAALFD